MIFFFPQLFKAYVWDLLWKSPHSLESGLSLQCSAGLRVPQWRCSLGEILANKRASSLLVAIGVSACHLHILLGCFLLPMIVRNDTPCGIQVYIAIMLIEVRPMGFHFPLLMLPLSNVNSLQNWTLSFFSSKLARCIPSILNKFGLSSLES